MELDYASGRNRQRVERRVEVCRIKEVRFDPPRTKPTAGRALFQQVWLQPVVDVDLRIKCELRVDRIWRCSNPGDNQAFVRALLGFVWSRILSNRDRTNCRPV